MSCNLVLLWQKKKNTTASHKAVKEWERSMKRHAREKNERTLKQTRWGKEGRSHEDKVKLIHTHHCFTISFLFLDTFLVHLFFLLHRIKNKTCPQTQNEYMLIIVQSKLTSFGLISMACITRTTHCDYYLPMSTTTLEQIGTINYSRILSSLAEK